MNDQIIYLCLGVGSLVFGVLFLAIPRSFHIGFSRIDFWGKLRQELTESFPALFHKLDDMGVLNTNRIVAIIFFIQAALFFILWAFT